MKKTARESEIAEDIQTDSVMQQFLEHATRNPDVLHLCDKCGTSVLGVDVAAHLAEHTSHAVADDVLFDRMLAL